MWDMKTWFWRAFCFFHGKSPAKHLHKMREESPATNAPWCTRHKCQLFWPLRVCKKVKCNSIHHYLANCADLTGNNQSFSVQASNAKDLLLNSQKQKKTECQKALLQIKCRISKWPVFSKNTFSLLPRISGNLFSLSKISGWIFAFSNFFTSHNHFWESLLWISHFPNKCH